MVPLITEQASSDALNVLLREHREMVVWWGTWAECTVAISRIARDSKLNENDEATARFVLGLFASIWTEVRPTNDIRSLAEILSLSRTLKAADCLQLAAALRWCEGDVGSSGFVCLDDRLRKAAQDEGFVVLPELLEI